MDDSPDTGFFCAVDQGSDILYGIRKCKGFVVKSHPVGIIENCSSLQGLGKFFGIVEIECRYRYLITKRVLAVHRVGNCLHRMSLVQKTLGNVSTRVSKSSGDGMDWVV